MYNIKVCEAIRSPARSAMFSLSDSDILQFREKGYLLVAGVYAPEALSAARERIQAEFARGQQHDSPYDSPSILTDIYSRIPELTDLIFNEKYIAIVKSLIGPDAFLIPECALHKGRFINWHTDTTEQEMAGIISHRDLSTPILQVATYFQENDRNAGGGLTVIPGTHQFPDPFLRLYSKKWRDKALNRFLKTLGMSVFDRLDRHPEKIDIPSCAGDLLLFDLRLFHRSTFPRRRDGLEKFAVFNTFTCDTPAGRDYFQFMKRRPEPYYRYFREKPLAPAMRQKAAELDVGLWY